MNWSSSINHAARKHLGLSMNEYVIADFIHRMSGTKSRIPGWCYASRPTIAKTFDLSRRTVLNILQRLEEKGVIEVGAETYYLRSTMTWYNVVEANMFPAEIREEEGGEESARGVKKVHGGGEESSRGGVKNLHGGGEESSPNRVIDNKEDIVIESVSESAPEIFDPVQEIKSKILSASTQQKEAWKARFGADPESLAFDAEDFAAWWISKQDGKSENMLNQHIKRTTAKVFQMSFQSSWLNNKAKYKSKRKVAAKEKVLKSEDGLAAVGLR